MEENEHELKVEESSENVDLKENSEKVETKETIIERIKKKCSNKISHLILVALIIIIVLILILISILNKNENQIEIKVKSSLEKIVEKNDLETMNIAYNVIAKKCKDEIECDKNSNNIDDFDYVVSCKGTITTGIDFSQVKIEVDKETKKIVVEMPEATIKDDPIIGSIKFLNGEDVSASELPNARKLCQETVIEKSNADSNLIPSAKEQAKVVLEEFYSQWIKAYDKVYVVEFK